MGSQKLYASLSFSPAVRFTMGQVGGSFIVFPANPNQRGSWQDWLLH